MSIKKSFVEQDMLTKRKRLGWLGWVTIIVTASFLVALGMWAWRTMTQQPIPLEISPRVSNSSSSSSNNSVQIATTTATTNPPASQSASNQGPITWTVFKAQDQLGQDIWDAPPEIKAWVVKDYLDAMAWTDSLMFDLDSLNAQLDKYYGDKRLAEMRAIVEWEKQENKTIAISRVKRLPIGTVVSTFSQDGLKARVLDYHAAGQGQVFDLRTRKQLTGKPYPDSLHMVEMLYDANARRWKIAHELMIYDLEANQILWQEEWDSAK